MEQLIWTSQGRGEQSGYQICSVSPGWRRSLQASAVESFGNHGPAPGHYPDRGVLSCVQIGSDHYCSWVTYRRERSRNDHRRTLWVHALLLRAEEMEQLGWDVFSLLDAGVFLPPGDIAQGGGAPATLAAVEVRPPPRRERVNPFRVLQAVQVDAFCSALFQPAKAVFEWHPLLPELFRYIVDLLPRPFRADATFFGFVTGLPPQTAKAFFMPNGLDVRSGVANLVAYADLANGEYLGHDPTAFACAVAKLLKGGDLARVAGLMSLCQFFQANPLSSSCEAVVDAFHFMDEPAESGAPEDRVLKLMDDLAATVSPEAAKSFCEDQLLRIAERRGQEGDLSSAVRVLQRITELMGPPTASGGQRIAALCSHAAGQVSDSPEAGLDFLKFSLNHARASLADWHRSLFPFVTKLVDGLPEGVNPGFEWMEEVRLIAADEPELHSLLGLVCLAQVSGAMHSSMSKRGYLECRLQQICDPQALKKLREHLLKAKPDELLWPVLAHYLQSANERDQFVLRNLVERYEGRGQCKEVLRDHFRNLLRQDSGSIGAWCQQVLLAMGDTALSVFLLILDGGRDEGALRKGGARFFRSCERSDQRAILRWLFRSGDERLLDRFAMALSGAPEEDREDYCRLLRRRRDRAHCRALLLGYSGVVYRSGSAFPRVWVMLTVLALLVLLAVAIR